MENWLAATGYSAASSLRWFEGRGPFIPPWDYEDIGRGLSGNDWLRLTTLLSIWRAGQGDMVPYYAGPAAVRCAAGLLDGCRVAAIGDTVWERTPIRQPAGIAAENGIWYGSLAFRRTEWVSELIRREGEARFRQWWTSSRDLDQGFEAAYGQSMSASVREFTRIDTELRGERLPIRLGTTIEPMSVAAVVAWLCLFLALPLVAARRPGR